MDENAKRRLVGAAVLVALMVIFVPMLVHREGGEEFGEPIIIPDPPAFRQGFDASVEPGADDFRPPIADPGVFDEDPAEARAPAPRSGDLRPGVNPGAVVRDASPPGREPANIPRTTPAPPSPDPGATDSTAAQGWVVQVASLSAADAAERLRDELRTKGYPAFVQQVDINGVIYHRVRVGPEADRARAERMATAIGEQTGGTPLVQQHR